MHDIIFDGSAEQTVVAILYRREQLHCFDRVAVIENGKLVGIRKPFDVNL
jgi:ABC-type transport system involved in cytochrome bd biosynthesis fused ATPase/permease subunit